MPFEGVGVEAGLADQSAGRVEQVSWAIRNTDFTRTINTPDKARAYINEHMD